MSIELTYKPGPCEFCLQLEAATETIIYTGHYNFVLLCQDEQLPESLLVCPKRHVETVFDLSLEEWAELHEIIGRCQHTLKVHYPVEGFTVGWNCYPVGGQTIDHCHLHIISRFETEKETRGKGLRSPFKKPNNRKKEDRYTQKRIYLEA